MDRLTGRRQDRRGSTHIHTSTTSVAHNSKGKVEVLASETVDPRCAGAARWLAVGGGMGRKQGQGVSTATTLG